jgi:hypothetical protein
MVGRTGVMWVLAASAFWLSACGRVPQPAKIAPDTSPTVQPAAPAVQQITLHVPGMIDRQGIT